MNTTRRTWLRQAAGALAGFSVAAAWPAPASARTSFLLPDEKIRLTSNENPFGPSPRALEAMKAAAASSNRYPWDVTRTLREAIARRNGLSPEHVLIGCGSSEILGLAAQRAALAGGDLVAADPTFGIWQRAAGRLGLNIIRVPLTSDKTHDLPRMLASITERTQLVYVCNPNNPTGTMVDAPALRAFVAEASRRATVLLDEAYIEYTGEPSLAALVADNERLIVARTFSKIYGLAGARIGYALAHPATIEALQGLQPWSNHGGSAVSLAAALASLDDEDFLRHSRNQNHTARAALCAAFDRLDIPYIPSVTNFVFYSLRDYPGDFAAGLEARGFLIGRPTATPERWARLTVGAPEEMQRFIGVLDEIWKS